MDSSMTPREEYQLLEQMLLHARALGIASEEDDDAFLERMDELWLAMSDEDRRQVEKEAAMAQATPTEQRPMRVTEIPPEKARDQLPRAEEEAA